MLLSFYKEQRKVELMYKKTECFCKCGKFLYFIKNGWITIPKGVKVSSNGQKFIIQCSCGKKTEVRME